MAGLWIQWVKGLVDRNEVLQVAHKLNVDRRIVASCCMLFWEWADDNTTNGYIRGGAAKFIDEKVNLPGFARELEAAGWIRLTVEGVTIVNFDHHNGETAKVRALDARRKAIARKKEKAGKS